MQLVAAEKELLRSKAEAAEEDRDYRLAAELYGKVFKMERTVNGMTKAARNQMRCMFAAWRLECQ
jgi:hypothetical protein